MLKGLKIRKDNLGSDLVAGLSAAIVNIPQGMAYGLVAGIDPVFGLYSGIVPPIVGAIFTHSKFMMITVTGEMALVAGAVLLGLGGDADISALVTLTLLVGLIAFLFGALRLDSILRFVSNAVMTGFLAGTAILIAIGQLDEFTGYTLQVDGNSLQEFWDWLTNLPEGDLPTLFVGILSIALIILLQRSRLKNLSMITALILASLVVIILDLSSVALVSDISDIPRGLPAFTLPDLSLIPSLIVGAFAIAIIGLVDSAGTSMNLADREGIEENVAQDYIGIGLGNIAGAFFQSMPSAGSLSRSNVTISAGGKSRWANIFAGIILALLLITIGSLAELIPMSALAGLLIFVGIDIVIGMRDEIVFVWKTSRVASAAMIFTFIAVLVLPLLVAILLAVSLSLLLFIAASSTNIRIVELAPVGVDDLEERSVPEVLPSDKPTVLRLYGSVYFAAVPTAEEHLPSYTDTNNAVVILNIRGRTSAGSTFLNFLHDYARDLARAGNLLMLAGVSEEVMNQIRETGLINDLGEQNIFMAEPGLNISTYRALEAARTWIKRG
jgi:SulP family sulfate permease